MNQDALGSDRSEIEKQLRKHKKELKWQNDSNPHRWNSEEAKKANKNGHHWDSYEAKIAVKKKWNTKD